MEVTAEIFSIDYEDEKRFQKETKEVVYLPTYLATLALARPKSAEHLAARAAYYC